MNFVMMLFMLFGLWGIAALYFVLPVFRKNGFSSVRCLALAVLTVVLVQGLAGLLGRLLPHTMWVTAGILLAAGMAGHFVLLWSSLNTRRARLQLSEEGRKRLGEFYSPGLLCTGAAFLLGLVLMRNLLVFRYDDLKQWGSAAKFMTEQGAMPREEEFFGSLNHYLTPVFFTSFFGIGGRWLAGSLVESNLYAASLLLSAVGICLPLGEFGWDRGRRVFGIFGLSLLSVTVFYYHAAANLYVDIPFAAWAGGIIGWLILRRRISGPLSGFDKIFLGICLFWLALIKWGYGILGVLVCLAAWFIIEASCTPSLAERTDKLLHSRKFWLAAVSVCGIGLLLIWMLSLIFGPNLNKVLPGAGGFAAAVTDILFSRTDKAVLTTEACIRGLSDQLVTRGFFHLAPLTAVVLIGLCGHLQTKSMESIQFAKELRRLNTAWLAGSVFWFILILVTYVSNFAESEAVTALSFNRYMGLYLMTGGFVLLLLLFLPEEYLGARTGQAGEYQFHPSPAKSRGVSMRKLMQILCCLLFILNTDYDVIRQTTSLDTAELAGYENVEAVKAQSEAVKELTGPEDAILFIAQYGAERSLHRARFDVGMNVSGHKPNTYHFSATAETGTDLSQVRPPEDLPLLLDEGGYDYIWVYRSDRELNRYMKEAFGFSFRDASLYRVVREGAGIRLYEFAGLEETR